MADVVTEAEAVATEAEAVATEAVRVGDLAMQAAEMAALHYAWGLPGSATALIELASIHTLRCRELTAEVWALLRS